MRVSSPFATGYRLEMDITKELNTEDASYFQSQIGVLRWIVEIGWIDVITEVSLLASQRIMAMPREGHMMQVFRCFAYLKARHNGCIVFDPCQNLLLKADRIGYGPMERLRNRYQEMHFLLREANLCSYVCFWILIMLVKNSQDDPKLVTSSTT
jgi:hypothetical protein